MKKGNTMSTESSASTPNTGSTASNASKGSEHTSKGPTEGPRDQIDSALKNMNASTPHMGTGGAGAMREEGAEVKVFDKRSQHQDGAAASSSKMDTEEENSSSSKFETLKDSASKMSEKACKSMKGMKKVPVSSILLGASLVSLIVERRRSRRSQGQDMSTSSSSATSKQANKQERRAATQRIAEKMPSRDEIKEKASQFKESISSTAGQYGSRLKGAVRDEPITACLVAAGIGTIGALTLGRRGQNSSSSSVSSR